MIDCNAYRRALLADPHASDAELEAHRASCADCARFTEGLLKFEARLERALRVPLPEGARPSAQVVPLRRAQARPPWLAMAASVLMAVVVAGALWVSTAGPSLAAAVVTHMGGEPQAWATRDAVPQATLAEVLHDSHLSLAPGAGVVSYASSCSFRGHQVPHLVIQTESGPVTVMVLVHEHVMRRTPFDEDGYRGVIVPVKGHGDLAVLSRGAALNAASLEQIARRVNQSIVWGG